MTQRERLFGNDLRLVPRAGGLDLIARPAGDLELAEGNDNIVQALRLRLLVRQGELARLGSPGYGSRIHELIGEPNSNRTRVILMAHARSAIERDPRVREVASVRVETLPGERDMARVEMEILLIEEPAPLNLVFDVDLGGSP